MRLQVRACYRSPFGLEKPLIGAPGFMARAATVADQGGAHGVARCTMANRRCAVPQCGTETDAGGTRAEPEASGRPIGSTDLLIAAHACVLAATVVTANVSGFRRIRCVNVENWLE